MSKKKQTSFKKPLWYKIKEKWSDEVFRKKFDNYFFFLVIILMIIVAAVETINIRNKQSLFKVKEALSTLDNPTKEENPKIKDAIFKTKKEKYEATLNKLNKVISATKYTSGQKLALFYKGIMQSDVNNYEGAVKTFNAFLKYKNSPFYPLGYLYKGICYEYLKKFDKAKDIFNKGRQEFKGTVYELYFAYYFSLDSEITNSLNDETVKLLEQYKDIKGANSKAYIANFLKNRINYLLSK